MILILLSCNIRDGMLWYFDDCCCEKFISHFTKLSHLNLGNFFVSWGGVLVLWHQLTHHKKGDKMGDKMMQFDGSPFERILQMWKNNYSKILTEKVMKGRRIGMRKRGEGRVKGGTNLWRGISIYGSRGVSACLRRKKSEKMRGEILQKVIWHLEKLRESHIHLKNPYACREICAV